MRPIGFGRVCGIGALCAAAGAWAVFGAGSADTPDPLAADESPSKSVADLFKEVPSKVAAKSPSKPDPLAPGETTTVTGAYQVAWLTLENGLPPEGTGGAPTALPMFLGLREGKCVQAWSATDKIRFNWFDRIELKLDGASLKGEMEGRARGRPSVLQGDFKYALDARVDGDKVSGSFTGTFAGTALSGKVGGTLRGEEEMARGYAIALDWTCYLGNEGTASAPPSKWKLVESLEQAKPVWKSEYYTPAGWGSGPDGRYADASYIEGVNGGASTPLVWDKKVYLYHYYPNPELAKEVKVEFNQFVRKTDHPVEIENLKKFGAEIADDFVLCLDSATGRTLWRARFPKRLKNVQTHKYRAANPTPWIEGGRIYVQNYAAGVYCLDAQTGKIIWEHPSMKVDKGDFFSTCVDSPNMTVAEGVVVIGLRGVLLALDAATGRQLWGSGWGFNAPVKWTAGERSYVISSGKCLDPKTGRVVWTAPVQAISYPRVSGDLLLGTSTAEDVKTRKDPKLLCLEMKPEGAKLKWSVPVTPVGTGEATMAIANGHVYFGGTELVCVNLDTGEVTGRQPKAGSGLNPTMCYSDGRVIIFPENHHGKMALHMVDADPKTLNVLNESWRAPHPTTTAYANMGIGILLVDGRLIARGQDGIYCYDLRKQ